MTMPMMPPVPPIEERREQLRARDRLVRIALFAADSVAIGAHSRTRADATRTAVTEAIGYLIGHGLITMKPLDEWPEYLALQTPDHLSSAIPAGSLD